MRKDVEVLQRIIARLTIDENGCWIYEGWDDGKGYRKISVRGHGEYVHRFMFKFFKGTLRGKQQVDHVCCNRSCCNPDHLQRVTNRVNARLRDKRIRKKKREAASR